MDSDRFDDLLRILGKSESRRRALAVIVSLPGLTALAPLELNARKKKKKEKKRCKSLQFNCDSANTCCPGLTCGGQQSCPAYEGKPYCCAGLGKPCNEHCDCCDENSSCGSDSRCCFDVGEDCTANSQCCPGLFCNLELSRPICSNPP